jgi:hypothetical protein
MNTISHEQVLQQPGVSEKIAERAYYISENAGFLPGRELDFWLQAESELINELTQQVPATKKAPRKTAAKSTADGAPAKTTKPRASKATKAVDTVEIGVPTEAKPARKRAVKKAD